MLFLANKSNAVESKLLVCQFSAGRRRWPNIDGPVIDAGEDNIEFWGRGSHNRYYCRIPGAL